VVIQADKLYGRKESVALQRLAGQIGKELFHETVEIARERFKSLESIQAFAATIERPEARALIHKTVAEMANADEVVQPEEQDVLRWLAELWQVEE
jgi:uncharacterized tellurite resistance protein B-like protein